MNWTFFSEDRGAETAEWIGMLAALLLMLIALSTVFDGQGGAIGGRILDQTSCKVSAWTGGGSCGSTVAVQDNSAAGNDFDLVAVEETAESNSPAAILPGGPSVGDGAIGGWQNVLGQVLYFLIPPAAANPLAPTQPATDPNELLTHDEAWQLLASGGITRFTSSNNNCIDASKSDCTSLDNVRRESIEGLIDFKQKCDAAMGDCTIVIKGGTETGHSTGTYSHANGYKIDFQWSFDPNRVTDNDAGQYIKDNFTPVTNRGTWGEAYEDPDTGYLYVLHGPPLHWDVCFDASC